MLRSLFLFFLVIVVGGHALFGQKVEINLGPDEITQNEAWTISLTVYNTPLKTYDKFPDIKGFRKGAPSQRTYTSSINGKVSSVQSVIMNYHPVRAGIVDVPSFSMKVNNQLVRVSGKKVTVKQGVLQQPNQHSYNRKPDDFFGSDEPDFVDVKDQAFLALTTDKTEVYVGEGVNATLAFYMPENNLASIRWYDLSKQLTEILKKLKPTNCWEENFDIQNVEGNLVTINGKEFLQYRIYQAMYFPFNTQTISFPAVSLDMIKLKMARTPSYFRPNSQESFKTYHSKPVVVTVKDLPPHPLKNSVAVGEFRLDERILETDLRTGQSAAYEFNIHGEGNIAAIQKPEMKAGSAFEVYDPSSRQEISKSRNRIVGKKSFRYFMIPKEPGRFSLKPYFQWVYFSPERKRYDTLRSNLTVFVTGESKKNEVIDSQDPGTFYERIGTASNALKPSGNGSPMKWIFRGFLLIMVGASVFLLFRK
jgi:hypothetical protein